MKQRNGKHFLIIVLKWFLFAVGLCMLSLLILLLSTRLIEPKVKDTSPQTEKILVQGNHFLGMKHGWIQQNEFGLFEMYVEGTPYERGLRMAKLSGTLIRRQEKYFIDSIKDIIPNEFYLRFLRIFIAFFNRDIDKYIPQENLEEIYGVSSAGTKDFDFIGSPYERILNYHAAHDIGHALQGMNMVVGCTSFSLKNAMSSDSNLYVCRNFDFYVGDNFAKDKIVCFVHPDSGIDFATVTWGGMTGVVSGMNVNGLSVTINASQSDLPKSAKKPISILCREILQYASTVDEAIDIVQRSETFVSESIMIGSALDNKTIIIEKSPSEIDVYSNQQGKIICSNHFQSKKFLTTEANMLNIQTSNSMYRYNTVLNSLEKDSCLSVFDMANLLRKRDGMNGEILGNGNEMAINQLICHHSVIFNNTKKIMWVSAGPYQIGKYIPYSLPDVFDRGVTKKYTTQFDPKYIIDSDSFIYTDEYRKFEEYKLIKSKIKAAIKDKTNQQFSNKTEQDIFIQSNKNYYNTYVLLGDYEASRMNYNKALEYYNKSLTRIIPSKSELESIQRKIENSKK